MIRTLDAGRTLVQKEFKSTVVDLLKDGPKTSVHLCRMLYWDIMRETESSLTQTLTLQLTRAPVWYDDEEGRWYLLDKPHIPHPVQKRFRFPGERMVTHADMWNGIGGIQALWTQGR